MVECEWAILCDSVFRDERKKMCLIGVFSQIGSASVPNTHSHAAIAAKFVGDPEEKFQANIEVVRPAGGSLFKAELSGLTGPSGVSEVILNLEALPLPDWGVYSCNIHIGEQAPKPLTFTVIKIGSGSRPAVPPTQDSPDSPKS